MLRLAVQHGFCSPGRSRKQAFDAAGRTEIPMPFLTRGFSLICGEKGIRTPGARESTTVFETAPFDHSGISPGLMQNYNFYAIFGLSYTIPEYMRLRPDHLIHLLLPCSAFRM